MVKVFYTPHAKEKLKRLTGTSISEDKVSSCLLKPEKVEQGYFGRKIAQITLTDKLVLRVVYEERDNNLVIITLYPSERRRYM